LEFFFFFIILSSGVVILKVFISDISIIKGKPECSEYYELIGELQSGLKIYINSYHYDLEGYIGCHVEMLLCVVRSPYFELERGFNNQLFLPNEYYSIELIDELKKKQGVSSVNNRKRLILTGEYIDSYIIPEEWVPLIESEFFKSFLKKSSALKTRDGTYLLDPFHLRKRIQIEQFPREVSIGTGCIDLAA